MVNTSIFGTSVIRHRSSCRISKENEVNGIIADNHVTYLLPDTEIPKNVLQQIIGCDFACDLAKEIE
jgi:hypothetical protein